MSSCTAMSRLLCSSFPLSCKIAGTLLMGTWQATDCNLGMVRLCVRCRLEVALIARTAIPTAGRLHALTNLCFYAVFSGTILSMLSAAPSRATSRS